MQPMLFYSAVGFMDLVHELHLVEVIGSVDRFTRPVNKG